MTDKQVLKQNNIASMAVNLTFLSVILYCSLYLDYIASLYGCWVVLGILLFDLQVQYRLLKMSRIYKTYYCLVLFLSILLSRETLAKQGIYGNILFNLLALPDICRFIYHFIAFCKYRFWFICEISHDSEGKFEFLLTRAETIEY